MKIIFSRKGFDSTAGRAPSPIIADKPISLPIPTQSRSETAYSDLGLGEIVARVTNQRLNGKNLCHCDPMFENGRCAFGQTGAAQSHLRNQGVGVGDVFLFFGLFANAVGRDRHHRIFGYLKVEEVKNLGSAPNSSAQPKGFSKRHPHTIGEWNKNNTLYVGEGHVVGHVAPALRLSIEGRPTSRWRVPPWLREAGLSYHDNPERWHGEDELTVVARGQEFVCDVADGEEAFEWAVTMIREILT